MTLSIVASPATRSIAETIIRETREEGADATMRHLPDVRPQQIAALVALLAKEAAKAAILPPRNGRPEMPLLFTEEERRKAHRRYADGDRDALTVQGEREYQRENQRRRKARAMREQAS